METRKALNRAVAARTVLENNTIREALDSLIEDAQNAMWELQAGSTGVDEQHRNVKSLLWLKQRLESYANSEQTHRAALEGEQRFRETSELRSIG